MPINDAALDDLVAETKVFCKCGHRLSEHPGTTFECSKCHCISFTERPPPGSEAARELGCACPVIDNGHGRGFPGPDGETLYVFNLDCKVHGREGREKTAC